MFYASLLVILLSFMTTITDYLKKKKGELTEQEMESAMRAIATKELEKAVEKLREIVIKAQEAYEEIEAKLENSAQKVLTKVDLAIDPLAKSYITSIGNKIKESSNDADLSMIKKAQLLKKELQEIAIETVATLREMTPEQGLPGDKGDPPSKEELMPLIEAALSEAALSEDEDLSAADIAERLNTLTEVIDIDVIKGLRNAIRSTNKRNGGGGGGGGGMGNPQHEQFSISAGTTTIKTTYTIAANGYAIFNITYQGMQLSRGDHYSVDTDMRTVRFNSQIVAQFENSTLINVVYVRG